MPYPPNCPTKVLPAYQLFTAVINRNELHTTHSGGGSEQHDLVGTASHFTTSTSGIGSFYVDVCLVVFLADVLWVYSLLEVRFVEVVMFAVLSLGRFALVSGVWRDSHLTVYVGGSHLFAIAAYGYIAKIRVRLHRYQYARNATHDVAANAVSAWASDDKRLQGPHYLHADSL